MYISFEYKVVHLYCTLSVTEAVIIVLTEIQLQATFLILNLFNLSN